MSVSFEVKIYTPAGLLLEDTAQSVNLPSSAGEIGVLPQHCRYTGLVGTGVLKYLKPGEQTARRLVVQGGFCNFVNDALVILADTAILAEQVDAVGYAKERGELLRAVAHGDENDPGLAVARQKLGLIEALDALIGKSMH